MAKTKKVTQIQTEWYLISAGALQKCLQDPELGQIKAWGLEFSLHLPHWWQKHKCLGYYLLFPI